MRTVQPSSLVFVAIIAGWVAYLLPRWVSRRDALRLSGSAHRDSAQSRVLSRRAAPTPTVSRAPTRSSQSLLTSPAPTRSPSVVADRRGPGLRPQTVDRPARRRAAARRARLLLTLSVVAITSWGIVALPGVPWWTALPATTLLALDVTAIIALARRRVADRHRTARRMARAVSAPERPRTARRPVLSDEVSPFDVEDGARGAARGSARGREGVRAGEGGAGDGRDRTWTPVPVPVPTYMLKPVVERPQPRPLEEDEVASAAQPVTPAKPILTVAPEPAPRPAAEQQTASGGPGKDAPRPWEVEHTWADDIDLFLARRRAVNG